jgi:hypothetical protein
LVGESNTYSVDFGSIVLLISQAIGLRRSAIARNLAAAFARLSCPACKCLCLVGSHCLHACFPDPAMKLRSPIFAGGHKEPQRLDSLGGLKAVDYRLNTHLNSPLQPARTSVTGKILRGVRAATLAIPSTKRNSQWYTARECARCTKIG